VADIHENALPGWVELKKIGDCLLRESLIDTTTEEASSLRLKTEAYLLLTIRYSLHFANCLVAD